MKVTGPQSSFQNKFKNNFGPEVTKEQGLQIFAKEMLVNRLFLGHYQERRYVDILESYRDVVVLNSSETDLKRDLDTVKERLQRFYSTTTVWIGITSPNLIGAPAGHSVWINMHNIPFGSYWFQIKEVKFSENDEISLRLKCIRSVDSEVTLDKQEQTFKKEPAPLVLHEDIQTSNMDVKMDHFVSNCTSIITMHNAKEVVCFSSVFLVACITGFFQVLLYVGDFTLKLMRELSIFLQASTPILLGVIDFFTKCVGGLYILISMMWRGTPQNFPSQTKMPYRPLPLPPNNFRYQKQHRY